MYQIGIIGSTEKSLLKLTQILSQSRKFVVAAYSRPDIAVAAMNRKIANGWILDLKVLTMGQKNLIKGVSEIVGYCPILILADEWDEQIAEFVKTLSTVTLVNRTRDFRSIPGILMRMFDGQLAAARTSVRKTPDSTINFNIDRKTVSVRDISEGGARIQVLDSDLKAGDTVRFEVKLPRVNATHIVKAKVMWVNSVMPKKLDSKMNRQNIGVKFVTGARFSIQPHS